MGGTSVHQVVWGHIHRPGCPVSQSQYICVRAGGGGGIHNPVQGPAMITDRANITPPTLAPMPRSPRPM